MVGFVGGAGGSFDYVQDAEPSAPLKGESWYDTDANGGDGEVKVYDGSEWNITGFTSHGDLTGITVDAHHSPVTVDTPLTEDGTQGLDLSIGDGLGDVDGSLAATLGDGLVIDANGNVAASLGNGLTIDGSGRVSIPAGAVNTNELAADAVTNAKVAADAVDSAQIASGAVGTGELGFDTATQTELDDHAGNTANPHDVTDDQTGAASALDNHAGDTTNPHNVTDLQTGAAAALNNHIDASGSHVPSGAIMMWSGDASDIPSGWYLCNGNNGTPDLRDRFVVGAGGSYTAGETGGTGSVQLAEGELPSHDHGNGTLSTDTDGTHNHSYEFSNGNGDPVLPGQTTGDGNFAGTDYAGSHNHDVQGTTAAAGSDNAHENRPPYYSLAYIMKA